MCICMQEERSRKTEQQVPRLGHSASLVVSKTSHVGIVERTRGRLAGGKQVGKAQTEGL